MNQSVISAQILYAVRETEAQIGQTVAQFYRASHAPRGTPARLHKRDRQKDKLRARWMGFCRVMNPKLGLYDNYNLGV